MKQLPSVETILRFLFFVWLTMSIISESVTAQTFDTTPPHISHQYVKLGKVNNPLSLVALISDQSGVREASVKVVYSGKSMELLMTPTTKEQTAPIKVKVVGSRVGVFSGPGKNYKKLGELSVGQMAEVTLVREDFYRIKTESGLAGYIDKKSCEPIELGWLYRVSLPEKVTQGKSLSYQIFAMDNYGNEAQTDVVEVKLLTEQELLDLQKQVGVVKTKGGTKTAITKAPFYTRPWFWFTAAAVGGGAYYIMSTNKDESAKKITTVMITIGW